MSIVLKVGAVACGLIAVGCVSKMSALNSEESSNVVGNIEGKYVLEKVNARGSGIDATRLREALLADQMLQTMLGGPVDDKQSLPVYVSVSATKKDANGGIATVNNVLAFCTLTIWPYVSAEEYEYTVTVATVTGNHTTRLNILNRNWVGLSPLAMIPVPGWADERGGDNEINAYHLSQVVVGVREACAALPSDYQAFLKDRPNCLEKIDQDRSETAFQQFNASADAATRVTSLAQIRNKTIITKHQNGLISAFKSAESADEKLGILKLLNDESIAKLPYDPTLVGYWSKITDQNTLAKIYRDGCGMLSVEDMKGIAAKIDDEAILGEMVIPPNLRAERERENEIERAKSSLRTFEEAQQRYKKRHDKEGQQSFHRWEQAASEARAKLQRLQAEGGSLYVTNDTARTALYCRINNPEVFGKIVSATDEYNHPLFKTREDLAPILEKMPEDKALEFALGKLEGYSTGHWNGNDFWPLEVAASLAGISKDSKTRVRLANAAFGKIESIKDECRNSRNFMVSWNDKDKAIAAKYAAEFPLSEDEKGEILAMGGLAGRRVAEIAGEETARKALTSGRSLGRDIEEQLVAKIPADKIDLPLYESVKSKVAKDALYEKMSDSVKESINAASATQEATASNKPLVKISVDDVNIATINMDDVVAAIKTWQKERWEADKIVAIRKSKGRVAVDDLKLSANYKEIQPFLDIMIADYIIYVNVLDSFVDAQTPKDAVAMLLKSLSMDDVLKMAKDFAGAVDSAKSIKDNAGWGDVVPIGKDMVTIYAVSSSMTNASGILKGIFNKLMSK